MKKKIKKIIEQNGAYLKLPTNSIHSHLNGRFLKLKELVPNSNWIWLEMPSGKNYIAVQLNEVSI